MRIKSNKELSGNKYDDKCDPIFSRKEQKKKNSTNSRQGKRDNASDTTDPRQTFEDPVSFSVDVVIKKGGGMS